MLHRDLVHDLDSKPFQGDNFAWMVGEQANGMKAEVGEDLGADAVLVLKLPLPVLAGVVHKFAAVREHTSGAVFPLNAEAGAGFVKVDQHAAAAFGNSAKRAPYEPAAIAAQGPEHIAV